MKSDRDIYEEMRDLCQDLAAWVEKYLDRPSAVLKRRPHLPHLRTPLALRIP